MTTAQSSSDSRPSSAEHTGEHPSTSADAGGLESESRLGHSESEPGPIITELQALPDEASHISGSPNGDLWDYENSSSHISGSLDEPLWDYEYSSLESDRHVRLLKLAPNLKAGHDFDIFSETGGSSLPVCSLFQADIDHVRPYTAISYTWEPEAEDYRILVNRRSMSVKENVLDLLTAMQRVDEDRYFWLDAICINQSDQAEKGKQVRMMGDIYESASHVISHLWSKK